MRQEGVDPVDAMSKDYLPAAMRASDADRDGVVSDLSEHFQAGRLTAGELDERTGRALAARTWGELGELVADLPAARTPAATSSRVRPRLPSGHVALALAGLGIAAVVLADVFHAGWGLIWLLLFVLFKARRSLCYSGGSGRYGQED
jgi:Domain of unknown function (DUF1707)